MNNKCYAKFMADMEPLIEALLDCEKGATEPKATKIEELNIRTEPRNILKKASITTVEELNQKSDAELRDLHYFGAAYLQEVRRAAAHRFTAKCKACQQKFEGTSLNDAYAKLQQHMKEAHPGERLLK